MRHTAILITECDEHQVRPTAAALAHGGCTRCDHGRAARGEAAAVEEDGRHAAGCAIMPEY
jgi:hypothetical protein